MKPITIALSLFLALPFLNMAASVPVTPAGSRALGSAVAPITIDLFSDFQCPRCKELHDQTLGLLISDYVNTGKVYLVRRYFPLQGHKYGRLAANYVRAAEKIGKYDEAADALYRTQESWAQTGKVEEIVCSALKPADAAKVRTLVKEPAVLAEIDKDYALGMSQKIDQTPTMIIKYKGRTYPVPGAMNYSILKRFLDNLLAN